MTLAVAVVMVFSDIGGLGVAVAAAGDLTLERLTAQEWRVFSDALPLLPAEGYPIRFHPQGTVETANVARAAQWTLSGSGQPELLEKDGETVWTFRWYPEPNLLVSCPRSPQSPVPPLALTPPGSTIDSVGASLRSLGVSRCGPSATRWLPRINPRHGATSRSAHAPTGA